MIKSLTRSVTAALLICASSQAIAQSSGWMVSEVSGPVFVDRDGKRVAARRGAAVEVGDTIATGARARAVLVHQNDFVTVASNSRVRIPKESKNSSKKSGTLSFVSKRREPRISKLIRLTSLLS